MRERLQRQLLRVMDRVIEMSFRAIKALDFNAIRIGEATRVNIDVMVAWSTGVGTGQVNFAVISGSTFGALYL